MNRIEGLRAMVRPMLLWMLGFGSFVFLFEYLRGNFTFEGVGGDLAVKWIWLFFAGCAEWILERPILKAVKK